MKAAARLLDLSAISLSGLCVVHCLALPLAAVALPMLGGLAEAEWAHAAFVAAAAPLAAAALIDWRGRATDWSLVVAAALGLGLMSAAAAAGWPSEAWETPLTVLGGLTLAAAHATNWRRHQGRRHAPPE